ncbi:MAG TPA: peptide chain release factor N(5)-glutamine methyltransferase [Stellaceae bacterium]|nr:peptide chain release factor N(5)-glutamine methyltransferase [Stellaceae bacterium]
MTRIAEALELGATRLAQSGIAAARREARLLLALAMEVDPAILLGYPERLLEAAAMRRFEALLARRAAFEPLSRIRGKREFWSLDFALSPATLDPRPDSETLIEALLAAIPDRTAPLRLVDFGTGTGCLLLAALSMLPNALGIGIDLSEGAARQAQANAQALGLQGRASFIVGEWDRAIGGHADLILANPPYLRSAEINTLAPEVRGFDPPQALDGGPDGLAAYRALAPGLRRLLVAGAGRGFLEVGAGQVVEVAAIMRQHGLQIMGTRADLGGIERCIILG